MSNVPANLADAALDGVDRRILEQLDDDARMPVAMIAHKLGLARGTCRPGSTRCTSAARCAHTAPG